MGWNQIINRVSDRVVYFYPLTKITTERRYVTWKKMDLF